MYELILYKTKGIYPLSVIIIIAQKSSLIDTASMSLSLPEQPCSSPEIIVQNRRKSIQVSGYVSTVIFAERSDLGVNTSDHLSRDTQLLQVYEQVLNYSKMLD